MALMAARGIIPMPDCAIFSDTMAEPPSVYRWMDWLEPQLPFPLHRVSAGSLTERVTSLRTNRKTGTTYYSNMIPAFVLNPDGTKGITGRSCTTNFKIIPIIQRLRALVGRPAMKEWRSRHREALAVISTHLKLRAKKLPSKYPYDAFKECQDDALAVQWIGISLDEVTRIKPARDPWYRNEWPLVDARMSRHDCLRWMEKNGFPAPPRSACSYCPFHSDDEWRRLRSKEPEAFAEAVRVEKALQQMHKNPTHPGERMSGVAYLHESLVPLDQVDFSTDVDHGQQELFQQECEGMCGI